MYRYMVALSLAVALTFAVGPMASSQQSSVRMFVRHNVNDYATWRKAYDDFDAERKTMGVFGDAVYRSVDNPKDVTVWHDFATAEKAKAFASSERLKTVMKRAGVEGEPQIWFTTEAK